jgi:cell wall-associated NlpC family hydrolase
MTRAEVVSEARNWVGVPYRKKGRTASGIDCLGLLVVVARVFNVPHVDHHDYSDWPDPMYRILRELEKHLNPAPLTGPLPGTIGVFNQRILPAHVGIFSTLNGVTHLIHAHLDEDRVLEQPWRARTPATRSGAPIRLLRVFVFPGLED